jgi:hypothetical protein
MDAALAWPTAVAGPASAAAVAPGGRQLLNLLSSEDSNWRVVSVTCLRALRLTHTPCRFLIFITVVVTVAMLVGNIYVLAFYAHPEDRNQAWFPKIVVLLGLTSFLSVLMLPLDRANRNACDQSKIVSACTFTLPMIALWCGLRWVAITGPRR